VENTTLHFFCNVVCVAIKLLNDLEKLLLQMAYKKCDKLEASTIQAASQTISNGDTPVKNHLFRFSGSGVAEKLRLNAGQNHRTKTSVGGHILNSEK
jgi:hypothetical protein